MSRPGKGRGLGLAALIGDRSGRGARQDRRRRGVREIEVARIRPNPDQPRRIFEDHRRACGSIR